MEPQLPSFLNLWPVVCLVLLRLYFQNLPAGGGGQGIAGFLVCFETKSCYRASPVLLLSLWPSMAFLLPQSSKNWDNIMCHAWQEQGIL